MIVFFRLHDHLLHFGVNSMDSQTTEDEGDVEESTDQPTFSSGTRGFYLTYLHVHGGFYFTSLQVHRGFYST